MFSVETPPDGPAAEVVGKLLDQAMDLSARFLSDRAGLSPSAAFVLNRVRREGPIRLTSLAAKEGVSQPSMTQLIQRLERQDLVARLADPDDGRATLVGITARGQALLEERTRIRRERLAELLATLSAEEECSLRLSALVASPILDGLAANADAAWEPVAAQPSADARSRANQT
jgi:DNA-binding MarR family transcriptional regulator